VQPKSLNLFILIKQHDDEWLVFLPKEIKKMNGLFWLHDNSQNNILKRKSSSVYSNQVADQNLVKVNCKEFQ
jgi:hypothetical protein